MKKIGILFFATFFLFSCQKKEYKLTIANVPDEFKGATAYLTQQVGRDVVFTDSALVLNDGSVTFTGVQDTAVYRTIVLNKDKKRMIVAPVVLERGNITVTFANDLASVAGTESNVILQKYLDVERLYNPKFEELVGSYFETEETELEKRNAIEYQFDLLEKEFNEAVLAIVNNNLNNAAGAYAFEQVYRSLSDEDQISVLSKAGKVFLAQPEIARIAAKLERMKAVAIGKMFVDMTMRNPEGKDVSLSDFAGKGNYLVIDFWASWCGPCRRAMPELKRIYEAYKEKGVDVVGVSFDSNEKDWISCIQELGLPWHHMSDVKGWGSMAVTIYGVNAIPHLMLLGPDGTILAKHLNDASLEEMLKKLIP